MDRVGRVLAVVAAVGVVVSGCGTGPSQVGSAAIVGTSAVPLEQVQSRLDVALGKTDALAQLSAQGVEAPDIARDVVTSTVLHDLLARTAAADGITVTEADVDAALEESGGAAAVQAQSLYDLPVIRERLRDRLVAVRIAERRAPGLSVTADVIATDSRDDAAAKARVLAAGGPEAEALFTDNPQNSRRSMSFDAVRSPQASTVLFGLPVGRTAYFQPPQQNSWVVLRVTDRRTDPNADPNAAASLGEADLAAIGQRLLQPLAEEVGVRVNPRFGVWDPVSMSVVPDDQESGAVLPLMG